MAGEQYTVTLNRRDGVVEITRSDKGWIAEQPAASLTLSSPSNVSTSGAPPS